MIFAAPVQRARLGNVAGCDAYLLSGLVATSLIFSTQPAGAVAGEPFTTQPVVTVRDQHGATLTSFTGNVTIAKQSGTGTLSGTLVKAAVAGVATFTNLQIDTAGSFVLRASIASPVLTVDSASFAVSAPPGFTFIDHTGAASTSTNEITTPAIDTTGATLLVVSVASFEDNAAPTLTDSKSNTWIGLTQQISTASRQRLFYCFDPIVGSGHTFTATGAASYPTVCVQAFAAPPSAVLFGETGAANSSTSSIQPGIITPPTNGALLVTGLTFLPTDGNSIDSDFIKTDSFDENVNNFGGAQAYLIQPTAGAVNPTWTTGTNVATAMACFTLS